MLIAGVGLDNLESGSGRVLAASKGLGRACAFALAREGANVTIGSRDLVQLAKTAAEIREQTGADVRCQSVDVTDASQVNSIFDAATAAFGPLGRLSEGIDQSGNLLDRHGAMRRDWRGSTAA